MKTPENINELIAKFFAGEEMTSLEKEQFQEWKIICPRWCRPDTGGFKDLHICGSKEPNGGKKHERYFNETAFRSRCSLWTSDKKMEP